MTNDELFKPQFFNNRSSRKRAWLLSGREGVKWLVNDVESVHCHFYFITEDLFDIFASA